jgi:hypothetical protein
MKLGARCALVEPVQVKPRIDGKPAGSDPAGATLVEGHKGLLPCPTEGLFHWRATALGPR